MMLYTIIDPQEIFLQQKNLKYSYKKVDNCILEGVQYNNDILISRIVSTNPKDYLNANYQLGTSMVKSVSKKSR